MKKILSSVSIIVGAVMPFMASAATFDHDLYFGMLNNSEVTMLQEFLRDKGFYNGPITGGFFFLTRQAVAVFQEKEGITPAQGYFGPKSRARANALAGVTALSQEEQIALLQAQIKALEVQIAALIAQQQATPTPSPAASPSVSATPMPSVSETPVPSPSPTPVAELRISGSLTQRFPDTAVSPLKIGDITIKNTTDNPILFNQFKLDIYDAMNSSLNRSKTVIFKLRDGTTTFDTLISQTNFEVNSQPPPTGSESNRRQSDVSFPITLKSGETKVSSLWIENLDYVISGYLRIEMLNAYVNDATPQGGFTFLLTNQ
ncbi:MAG: peptidoglycan-binding domain-containing protein [bacterium]|nr:peptidoglycan-binding domain-containing protein [bacterium]